MAAPQENDRPYRVIYSGYVRTRLKDWAILADLAGIMDKFLASLKQIDERLGLEAEVFGEPLFTLRAAKLEVRNGAVDPLSLIYGVHREKKIAFVKDFHLMGY